MHFREIGKSMEKEVKTRFHNSIRIFLLWKMFAVAVADADDGGAAAAAI